MMRVRDMSDPTPRWTRWPRGKNFVHKPPGEVPPSFLLVAVLKGIPMCLDVVVDPDIDGDDYPAPGTMGDHGFYSFDAPTEDGFYIVSFNPHSVKYETLEGTEWDVENDDEWRKLSEEEVKELAFNGFDNYLGEEQDLWKKCLDAWPCQTCGRPRAEHVEDEGMRLGDEPACPSLTEGLAGQRLPTTTP